VRVFFRRSALVIISIFSSFDSISRFFFVSLWLRSFGLKVVVRVRQSLPQLSGQYHIIAVIVTYSSLYLGQPSELLQSSIHRQPTTYLFLEVLYSFILSSSFQQMIPRLRFGFLAGVYGIWVFIVFIPFGWRSKKNDRLTMRF
jgi:hypothetical protein